jgi:hypothetical protein
MGLDKSFSLAVMYVYSRRTPKISSYRPPFLSFKPLLARLAAHGVERKHILWAINKGSLYAPLIPSFIHQAS